MIAFTFWSIVFHTLVGALLYHTLWQEEWESYGPQDRFDWWARWLHFMCFWYMALVAMLQMLEAVLYYDRDYQKRMWRVIKQAFVETTLIIWRGYYGGPADNQYDPEAGQQ